MSPLPLPLSRRRVPVTVSHLLLCVDSVRLSSEHPTLPHGSLSVGRRRPARARVVPVSGDQCYKAVKGLWKCPGGAPAHRSSPPLPRGAHSSVRTLRTTRSELGPRHKGWASRGLREDSDPFPVTAEGPGAHTTTGGSQSRSARRARGDGTRETDRGLNMVFHDGQWEPRKAFHLERDRIRPIPSV